MKQIPSLVLSLILAGAIFEVAAVDDDQLLAARANPNNWLTFGQNYTNQRYCALDEINRANVGNLAAQWVFRSGLKGPFQAQPLVSDGVMLVTLPGNHVVALDATNGREIWRYEHVNRYAERTQGSPANRGAALGYGKVFEATNDGRLVALDTQTGAVVWDRVIVEATTDELKGLSPSEQATLKKNIDRLPAKMPPVVYRGKVIVGVTSAGYGIYYNLGVKTRTGAAPPISDFLGQRGFVAAYDAHTGAELWRWHTTKELDWSGAFSATTPSGEDLGRDIAAEREAIAGAQDIWRSGGSSTWSTPALDPDLGLLFVGTGNASPNDVPSARPGDNLYTSSLVAIDIDSGEVRWHYQQVPQDVWGYDVASASILFDTLINGAPVPAVGIAGKTGWFYVHDRRDGKLLFRSEALVPQNNMFVRPSPEGVLISPGSFGGVSWSPGSYDPNSGAVYLAAIHRPTRFSLHYAQEKSGPVAYTATDIAVDAESWGTLSAVDTRNNGRLKWQVKTPQPLIGGVLASAGGLVFSGEGSGNFAAFDSATGERLWGYDSGSGVNAPPVCYAVDGRQYIAVAAGGSRFFGFAPGDQLLSFALPDSTAERAPKTRE